MERMSKKFYLGSFIGGIVLIFFLAIVFIVMAVVVPNVEDFQAYAIAGAISFIILLIAVVIYLVVVTAMMFYKMWEAINDEEMPIHPVVATVLIVIPIINFFWSMAAYPLFMKYYNEYIERRAIGVNALKPGLFYAYPALLAVYVICSVINQIVSIIPDFSNLYPILISSTLIGSVAYITAFVVFLVLVANICDAVNRLPQPAGE